MCGENHAIRMSTREARGSSPRVRGKQGGESYAARRSGLIPACAGKTPRASSLPNQVPAHPRVCGENTVTRAESITSIGSSPRVRGKRAQSHRCRHRSGLIPACAGKTESPRFDRARNWAHPRVCGENFSSCSILFNWSGSSPRVRGKPTEGDLRTVARRLIPACAGKTVTVYECVEPGGSSPRVRGKLHSPTG